MQTKNGMFNQINITPLTDIFLVLLVVMIIISPGNQRSVLKIDPPQAAKEYSAPLDESAFVHIRIDNAGKVSVEGHALSATDSAAIETELNRIQKERANKDVCVKIVSRELTSHQCVVSALDASCGAGIKSVSISEEFAK